MLVDPLCMYIFSLFFALFLLFPFVMEKDGNTVKIHNNLLFVVDEIKYYNLLHINAAAASDQFVSFQSVHVSLCPSVHGSDYFSLKCLCYYFSSFFLFLSGYVLPVSNIFFNLSVAKIILIILKYTFCTHQYSYFYCVPFSSYIDRVPYFHL